MGVVVRTGYTPLVYILPYYGWFTVPICHLKLYERAQNDDWTQFQPAGYNYPDINFFNGTFRNSVLTIALEWLAKHTKRTEQRIEHNERLQTAKYYYNQPNDHALRAYKAIEDLSESNNVFSQASELLFETCALEHGGNEYAVQRIVSLMIKIDSKWLALDECRVAVLMLFFKSVHFRTFLLMCSSPWRPRLLRNASSVCFTSDHAHLPLF